MQSVNQPWGWRKVKTIQQSLDRLDEAFLFAEAIDATSYERHAPGCAKS